ncbi:MAG: hypothetical protein L0154_21445 [Chloroflexi bacterium]|nr:hypothetical protein [Chloroflexota bacterium]
MEQREIHLEHLRSAEGQFRLATATRLAVTFDVQPLDLPIQWSHGKHIFNYSEIALSNEEANFAAWNLQRSATFLMASAILYAIKGSFQNPKSHSNPQVINAYQIVRMIRNAFSHNPFNPVWHIDDDCRNKRFEIEGVIQLDCTSLDGKAFDWRDYGGPLAILALSRFVRYDLLGDNKDQKKVPLPKRVYVQQGDLIFMKVDEIPVDAVPVKVERLPDGGILLGGGHVIYPVNNE